MLEKEKFSFGATDGDFGILATDSISADDVDNFLNDKPLPKKEEKKEDPLKKKVIDPKKKVPTKKEDKEELVNELPDSEIEKFLAQGDNDNELEEENTEEEEEEITVKKKEKKEESEDDSDEEDEINTKEDEPLFKSISKELIGLGVFKLHEGESEDDLPDTPEEFADRFALEKKEDVIAIMDNFLSKFGDDYKDMFDNVFVKGIKPEDYLQKFVKINSIKELDISLPENWERVVRENLKREGYPSARIETKIEQYKQYGDLEDEAKLAQVVLLKKEEEDLQADTQKREADLNRKKQIKDEFVNNVSKILTDKLKDKEFDGIPVDPKVAQSVHNYLTKGKYQNKGGEILTEFEKDFLDLEKPENHPLKVKVALLMQMLKEDPKLTKIQSRALSKESKSVFSQLVKKDKKKNKEEGVTAKSGKKESSSWF